MAWKEEIVMRDVSHAGILVSDGILREASSHIDLEEALEASRYVSNPHSSPPREERLDSGVESVGNEDVARALLSACKVAIDPVLNTYDQLLSRGAILASPKLRLRLLRSILTVLREWAMSVLEKRTSRSIEGSSPLTIGAYLFEQKGAINMGLREKITREVEIGLCMPLSHVKVISLVHA